LLVLSQILHFKPYVDEKVYRNKIISEVTILLVGYHMPYFSDFTSVEEKAEIGNSVIYICCASTLTTLSFAFAELIWAGTLKLKHRVAR